MHTSEDIKTISDESLTYPGRSQIETKGQE